MPTYISLISYTEQGLRNIKDAPKRKDAARRMLKEMGGDLKEVYLTLGQYDIVAIAEAPSDEVMAEYQLRIGALGFVRTTTLKAFPDAEFKKIIAALP